jgi:hypothetical protein
MSINVNIHFNNGLNSILCGKELFIELFNIMNRIK